MHLDDRISAFRASISPNLLASDDFIDWQVINRRLGSKKPEILQLQAVIDQGPLTQNALAGMLRRFPSIYPLLLDLVAFNSSDNQVEKWGFPPAVGDEPGRIDWVASQLMHVGVDRILDSGVSVLSLLRVAEVHKDSYRRRFRSAGQLDDRTRRAVMAAVRRANLELMQPTTLNPDALTDASLRRSLAYVLAIGSRPIAGITTAFQNQSGDRQQYDLLTIYPALQERLGAVGMPLILITDGQGLKEALECTLTALFEGVRFPMTLSAAEGGSLVEAIIDAASLEGAKDS
ncbi:MAG TPA: hypothetical protein VL752_07080 [Acidisoma sp.]|jgi:hypothetical protein|uniref:hypothetical protein n=1 Tax=Acidisoma sp. TaxID=1872115 RepID=UPI002CB810D1|nr:hypothetical protein [Acidisoma sp.]HTI00692.1 hypothetical protein [Acidisoma sp.]